MNSTRVLTSLIMILRVLYRRRIVRFPLKCIESFRLPLGPFLHLRALCPNNSFFDDEGCIRFNKKDGSVPVVEKLFPDKIGKHIPFLLILRRYLFHVG